MMTVNTTEGQFECLFFLFGIRVPYWVYAAAGPFVPRCMRTVDVAGV